MDALATASNSRHTPHRAGTLEVAEARLYSVTAIVIATLLGTSLAGAFLCHHNLSVLGRANELFRLWAIAISLFAATFALAALLPEAYGRQLLVVPEALAMLMYAKLSFAGSAQLHAKGFYSNWRTVGICLLLLLAMLAAIMELAFFLSLF
ncbi:hypothetical protein [Pseudomonas sp. EL_65y_Pfl2_R95]|uniref:hypothetical protein n=1 Tax=Pseudomonas sp. EL_65y_Pfl2_R95 TaxID=3088698 RepID=UPI0030DD863E